MPYFWKLLLWTAVAVLPGGVLLLPFALRRRRPALAEATAATRAR